MLIATLLSSLSVKCDVYSIWLCQGKSRYFLYLTGPIFQQVEGDVSSQQFPLQSREEERGESPKEGSSNKGMCVSTPALALSECMTTKSADYCMLENERAWSRSRVCLLSLEVDLGSV